MTPQSLAKLASLVAEGDLINELNAARPKLGGDGLEEKALNASVVEGWERCVSKLESMAREIESQGTSSYVNTTPLG
jgi:hypothetical protein